MAQHLSNFEIRVLRRDLGESVSPAWAEAVVLIDGRERLALLGQQRGSAWIGRRPDEIIEPESPLLPGDDPYDAFLACCDCGELGCGALVGRISERDGVVTWDRLRVGADSRRTETPIDAEPFRFDAARYRDAVLGRADPSSDWRPTTRRAAVLVEEGLAGRREVRGVDVQNLGDRGIRVLVFRGPRGERLRPPIEHAYRLLAGESAEDLADRVVTLLGSDLSDDAGTARPDPTDPGAGSGNP